MTTDGQRLFTVGIPAAGYAPADERQLVTVEAAEEWLGTLRRRTPERGRLATVIRRVPSTRSIHLFMPGGYLVTGETEHSRLYLRLRRLKRDAKRVGVLLAAEGWSDDLTLDAICWNDHVVECARTEFSGDHVVTGRRTDLSLRSAARLRRDV